MNHFIKSCSACCVLMLWFSFLYAQPNITRVEYYLDVDPGYGKATAVSIIAAKNLSNITINLNPSGISNGVHILGIRAKDANGAWKICRM